MLLLKDFFFKSKMGINEVSQALGETQSESYLHSAISERGFEIPISTY